MKEFTSRVESIRKIMDYAKDKMNTDQVRKEIEKAVTGMKEYFKNIKI